MKRFAAVTMGIALAGLGARADDAKAETKVEAKHNADGTGHVTRKTMKKHHTKNGTHTETMKSEHDVSKNISGGTTETKEMKADHDAPGAAADSKMDSKETIKRDKNGNVVKHEKTETK